MAGILTICTANVCRSPAAAGIVALLGPYGVTLESAGVAADDGRHMCHAARAWLESQVDSDLGEAHRSRFLTADMLARTDLVLVASLRQRQLVAAMLPTVMGRLFTYREAALLATHANLRRADVSAMADASSARTGAGADPEGSAADPRLRHQSAATVYSNAGATSAISGFVAEMASLRGVVRMPHADDELSNERSGTRWFRFRSPSPAEPLRSPYDVPDAHTTRDGDHGPTFDALGPAVRDLTAELLARLDPV